MDFDLILESVPRLAEGVPRSLALVSASMTIGFVLAVGLASLNSVKALPVRVFCRSYIAFFRATPMLVQIFIIYYGSGQFFRELQGVGLWWLFREAWFCAILAMALNTTAYTAEIIRGGLESVSQGQREAARALGLSRFKTFRLIVFPQAMRQALPAYGNEIILMLKASSLASTITILEITGIAKQIIAETYRPLEVFLIAGSLYLSLVFLATRGVATLERRMTPEAAAEPRKAPAKPLATVR